MNLGTLDFAKLLPRWMRDDDYNIALADAITDVLGTDLARVKTLRVWDQVDKLTSEELDELAWEMDIDWWESAWEIEIKRDVIKTAQKIISTKGTKYSVVAALTAIFGSVTVLEWFDYGGDPYHFKVETKNQMTPEKMAKFIKTIDNIKPVKAVLDSVDVVSPSTGSIAIGALNTSYNKNIIIMEV